MTNLTRRWFFWIPKSYQLSTKLKEKNIVEVKRLSASLLYVSLWKCRYAVHQKSNQKRALHVCSKKKTVLHSIELWWTSLNKFCTQVYAKSWQLTANVAPQGLRSHFGGFFKRALVAAVFCCCSCCCCWAWWIWDINGSSTSKELITYNAKGFF